MNGVAIMMAMVPTAVIMNDLRVAHHPIGKNNSRWKQFIPQACISERLLANGERHPSAKLYDTNLPLLRGGREGK
jgi:hypothetical protein